MALISRIFSNRKKLQAKKTSSEVNGFNPWRSLSLPSSRITVLVFRDCHVRGRRLLFDSSSVVKTAAPARTSSVPPSPTPHSAPTVGEKTTPALLEVEDGVGFMYKRQRADSKSLAEAVFGSVTLLYEAPANKLHVLSSSDCPSEGADTSSDEPSSGTGQPDCSRVLLSRVFLAPRTVADRKTRSSTCSTCPVDCPLNSARSSRSARSLLNQSRNPLPSVLCAHSGSVSLQPPSCLPTPYGTPLSQLGGSDSSLGSLHRCSRRLLVASRQHSCDLTNSPGGASSAPSPAPSEACLTVRKGATRLAVAILLSPPASKSEAEGPGAVHLAQLLSDQLQLLLCRLQLSTEHAYVSKTRFVRIIFAAARLVVQDIQHFLSATRLSRPVWLGLGGSCRPPPPSSSGLPPAGGVDSLAALFVDELVLLVREMDTKQMSFFVATLLTAVLTHHLGWVVSVLAPPAPLCSPSVCQTAQRLSQSSRILVVGSRTHIVDRVLFVLSYFVRQRVETVARGGAGAAAAVRDLFAGSQSSRSSTTQHSSDSSSNRVSSSDGSNATVRRGHSFTGPKTTSTRSSSSSGSCAPVSASGPGQSSAVGSCSATGSAAPARSRHLSHLGLTCHLDSGEKSECGDMTPPAPSGGSGEKQSGAVLDCQAVKRLSVDGVRESFHYLRGYYSYRYLQSGQARRVRYHSEVSVPVSARDYCDEALASAETHQSDAQSGGGDEQYCDVWCALHLCCRSPMEPWLSVCSASDQFVSGATVTGCTVASWQKRLMDDLRAGSMDGEQCVCVVANTDDGSVCLVTATETVSSWCCQKTADGPAAGAAAAVPAVMVVLSPLVASLLENTCQLHSQCALAASLVLAYLERQLSLLTHRAGELVQLVANSAQPSQLAVQQALGVDSNDVTLLMAVASVICPSITDFQLSLEQ